MSNSTKGISQYALRASGDTRLQLCCLKKYTHYGYIYFDKGNSLSCFYLLHKNMVGLKFSVQMVDLEERWEEGVISVESITLDNPSVPIHVLPPEFCDEISVDRLTLETPYGDIDTGLLLHGMMESRIVLISAAEPYGIAVTADPKIDLPVAFLPNYEPGTLRKVAY